jgi:hypothetical protein
MTKPELANATGWGRENALNKLIAVDDGPRAGGNADLH